MQLSKTTFVIVDLETSGGTPAEGAITTRFYPTGKITGLAETSGPTGLKISHPLAKKLELQLSQAISLEFHDDNPFLEIMDNNQEIQLTPDK